MKRKRFFISTLAIFLILTGAALCRAIEISEHAYGNLPVQTLSVCLPTDNAKNRPGVIMIHGGGWTGGDKSNSINRCRSFAEDGIVAVTINYRLANSADSSTRWPAQIDDTCAAFQWMIDNSKKLRLDPKRISAYGESAGGHLAVWLGIKDKRLAGIVDCFGPTDLGKLDKRKFTRALTALFGSIEEEAMRAASPAYAVRTGMPPTLILQGDKDDLVPPDQSTELLAALKSKDVPVNLVLYLGGHSWINLSPQALKSIMSQVIAFVQNARPPKK